MRPLPAALLAAALTASASGLRANPGSPSRHAVGDDGLSGVRRTFSSLALEPGESVLAFMADGHASPTQIALPQAPGSRPREPQEALLLSIRSALAVGFGHGLDASLSLPYYYESLTDAGGGLHRGRGLGDLRLAARFVPPLPPGPLRFSLRLSATVPTAASGGTFPRELPHHPGNGALSASSPGSPFGTEHTRVGLGAGASIRFGRVAGEPALLHLNLEGERQFAPPEDSPLGLLRASAAIEVSLSRGFRLAASLDRDLLTADPLDADALIGEAASAALEASWKAASGFSFKAGGELAPAGLNPSISLRSAEGRIAYRTRAPVSAYVGVAYQGFPMLWDRDGDGIPDRRDRCPRRPEDFDGFEDGDGCPDIDNDRDGLVDGEDRCPGVAEDRDGFKDWDGCPDPDNDGDGVEDARDACRNDAEDLDGVQDEDGCPDLDNDRDGIPDMADKCPDQPENVNKYEDSDGCPEPDRDADGIPDKWDRCPSEAEIVNFYQDRDGCPDQKPEPVRSGVLQGVSFGAADAELALGSHAALDSLAELLVLYPGTEIEIQGHLDDRGGAGARALTYERAKAVARHLFSRGVEPRRLKPVGYGDTRPIAPNRTARGRQANRRIEIRRLN
jgi:outer membrane protein OmpA-like peptidoglycan-associated protein